MCKVLTRKGKELKQEHIADRLARWCRKKLAGGDCFPASSAVEAADRLPDALGAGRGGVRDRNRKTSSLLEILGEPLNSLLNNNKNIVGSPMKRILLEE